MISSHISYRLVANALGMIPYQNVHFSVLRRGGRRRARRRHGPARRLWRHTARPPGRVPRAAGRLCSSSSSCAASPVTLHTLRRTGYRLGLRSPAPGRRRRRAGGAVPVQDGYQAGHAGVCSALHRHPDVAPRSATTLASEWCTCAEQAARASPSSGEPARTVH